LSNIRFKRAGVCRPTFAIALTAGLEGAIAAELRRRLIITLNMTRVVQHIWEALRQENTEN
jgi:hypothetical protein